MIALVVVVAGAGVGAGLALLWRGLFPRPVPLADVLTFVETGNTRRSRWEALLARVPASVDDATLRAAGRTQQEHASVRVASSVAGGGTALGLLALAALVGFSVSGALAIVAITGCAGFGSILPSLSVRDRAAARRREFRHALSAYLDLVNVILAGGGGIETSLSAAAAAGDGWAFAALRDALDRARLTGATPWDAFDALGRDLDVAELCELAASVSLAGSHGARIRTSLAAKADSLRSHQLADVEAAAESATERMTIPVAVLLFGFLVFIAYPALVRITSITATP